MIRDPSWHPCFHLWYVLDCVAGVRRRGRGEGEGKRKRKRERGMRFSPPPLPRSLPFLCPHVLIRVCIRLRSRRQKERERGGRGEEEEKKGEGNALFSPSPSPSPALSRLCACHFLHIFNRFVSWEIIIPPHFQTPFQRNLLTSSGTPRREISRVQLPTPELLEEWLQSLGAVIFWIVWVIRW